MKKLINIFLLAVAMGLASITMQCLSSSSGIHIPAEAWTDGDESVGQLASTVVAVLQGDKVNISYDLADDADVWVIPSFDQGMSYCGALQSVTGAVGKDVTKGKGKTIVWNYRQEQGLLTYPFDIKKVKLKVFADSPMPFDTTPYVIYKNEHQQLVSTNGDVIADSAKYSAIMDEYYIGTVPNFMPIPVKDRAGKWGMIDYIGREVVPCKYDCIARANPFLYFALANENSDRVQILSNTGRLLGETCCIDSVCNGVREAIKIHRLDSVRQNSESSKYVPIVLHDGYIGKNGEAYSEYQPIGEFKKKAYYPFAYKEYPEQHLVVQEYINCERGETFTRGFESLNQVFWLNGQKVCFLEYMKDTTIDEYDYYIKMGYSNHAFRLPKGFSPYMLDSSEHTDYLSLNRIVKTVDNNTGLVGIYDIGAVPIIPCAWDDINVHINDNDDFNNKISVVNFYHCKKTDGEGIICVPTTEVEDSATYNVIAYMINDSVTHFVNPETQRALRPDKHRWRVYQARGNGSLITLKDTHRGTFALIDHDGQLVSDNVIRVSWVDSEPFTELIGLMLAGEPTTRYYDIKAHKFVDDLNGAEPYGCIHSSKYCMRIGDRTVVYDAEQSKITHTIKGKVPVNDYDGNRIFLTDKSGATYLADSTLAIISHLEIKLSKANKFNDGLCWCQDHRGDCHLIDADGKVIIPVNSKSRSNGLFYEFHSSLCRIVKNGKYGYSDQNGRVVIPCIYENAEDFNHDHAIVSDDGYHWGVIDRNGAMIYPCVFSSIALARFRAL